MEAFRLWLANLLTSAKKGKNFAGGHDKHRFRTVSPNDPGIPAS